MVAFQDDGEQTCMPQNVSSLVVYYNEKLFKQAGVAYPEPNWSWISIVQAAVKLTKDTDGDGADRPVAAAPAQVIRRRALHLVQQGHPHQR